MTRPLMRAALALLALASLALAGAGAARAADPTPVPTIGGALAVNRQTVTVQNRGNVPARVSLTTDGPATFTPSTFLLDPGADGVATVGGDPAGMVSAHFELATPTTAGDVAGVTLQAPFRAALPFDPTPWAVGTGGALAALITLYALSRWARANVHVEIGRRP